MSVLAAVMFAILCIAAVAIAFKLYPIVVYRMTAEEYYEGRDFFQLEDEMSDARLFRGRTPIEIIRRGEDE